MKKKVSSILLAVIMVLTGTVTAFAASPALEVQYSKQEYLNIVNELNAQYGAKVSLEFLTPGDYVSASEMPSPVEYRQQLTEMLQAQVQVRRAIVTAEAKAAAAALEVQDKPDISPFATITDDYTQPCHFCNIKVCYSASYTSGRYLFTAINSYEFNRRSIVWPEYTFYPHTKSATRIDGNRTIYVMGQGDLMYLTPSRYQLIEDW